MSQPSQSWSQVEVQAALEEITSLAAQDADFRKLCLTSPAEAVLAATGRELPEGFSLRFVDNAHADLTVVLPDLATTGELDEASLETIAGGTDSLLYKNLWENSKKKYQEYLERKKNSGGS